METRNFIRQFKQAFTNVVSRIALLENKERSETAGATTRYTVALLPNPGSAGRIAFATNGRKTGQGVGAGTGVLVYDDGTIWCRVDDGTQVAA